MPVIAVNTPVGRVGIAERDGQIVRVSWSAKPDDEPTALLTEAARQIAAYFAGEITEFDLPLDPGGNDLERQVFGAMRAIPSGSIGEAAAGVAEVAAAAASICGSIPAVKIRS